MAMQWTKEQEMVIGVRDRDILVSAAAGSGKTAVLVERIVSLVTEGDDPPDIDSLLVVTFTNAAAAEMRERIRTALEKKLAEDPDNVHLQKQAALVHNALITTIHSFCLEVIRTQFPGTADPGFRIADESETVLLKDEILSRVMEEAHADGRYDAAIRNFAVGKDDGAAAQQVLDLYEYSEAYPWPYEWRHAACVPYEAVGGETPDGEVPDRETCGGETLRGQAWMQYLLEQCEERRQEACRRIEGMIRLADSPGGPQGYRKALEDDLARFEQADFSDYDKARLSASMVNAWGGIGRISKKDEVDPAKKDAVTARRNSLKEQWKKLGEKWFARTAEQEAKLLGKCRENVEALVLLADRFEDHYTEAQRECGIVAFPDLEHMALQILAEKRDGTVVPTKAAESFARRFTCIMTDEYQDSNLVQEYILSAVSGNGRNCRNRFMVGDVKQSIYRFRQARPELFMEKYAVYERVRPAGEDEGTDAAGSGPVSAAGSGPTSAAGGGPASAAGRSRDMAAGTGGQVLLELHRNFRSRPQVLESVNRVFEQIMARDLGGIEYDADAMLYPGASFPEEGADASTRMYLLEDDGGDEDLTKKEKEAVLAAELVEEIVGSHLVTDRETGELRPARCGDIAILLRTVSGWADGFQTVFADRGIPLYCGAGDGFFDTYEVRIVLAFLKLLDNPRQDIPLAGVLRSAAGRFSDRELAVIRAHSPAGSFHDACMRYMENGTDTALKSRLQLFFDRLRMLRAEVPFTPLHAMIFRVLDLTGFGACVLAMPAGKQRKANLDLLVEKAIAFEKGSYKGLYHFLQFTDRLAERGGGIPEAPVAAEGEDVVRLMSIHKSKGLEFPIVLVCGLGKQFNRTDLRAPVIFHQTLGIGCRYFDRERHMAVTPLPKAVMADRLDAEALGEELRVLYVAMTRAREKLILTGTAASLDKAILRWEDDAGMPEEGPLPYHVRRGAGTFLDWLMPAIYRGGTNITLTYKKASESALADGPEKAQASPDISLTAGPDGDPPENIREDWEKTAGRIQKTADRLHVGYMPVPGAISVSQIKHREWEEAEEAVYELAPPPAGEAGGAERGTIYHSIMEFLDYGDIPADEDKLGLFVNMQLESLMNCGKIQKVPVPGTVDPEDIASFLRSGLGRRMREAAAEGRLHRETPFVIGMAAREADPSWDSDETVLVQGIIDAWFRCGDGQIILVDYKTDRVKHLPDPEGELDRHYRAQLATYARALEQLTDSTVAEMLIYSFDLGKAIVL